MGILLGDELQALSVEKVSNRSFIEGLSHLPSIRTARLNDFQNTRNVVWCFATTANNARKKIKEACRHRADTLTIILEKKLLQMKEVSKTSRLLRSMRHCSSN